MVLCPQIVVADVHKNGGFGRAWQAHAACGDGEGAAPVAIHFNAGVNEITGRVAFDNGDCHGVAHERIDIAIFGGDLSTQDVAAQQDDFSHALLFEEHK